AAYHFLLDYVPGWKWGYGKGGLIQYQTFFPKETAEDAFAALLKLNQERRMPNYLTVVKRHKPSDFLINYVPDGYSMAMDFRITNRNRDQVVRMARSMDDIVVKHGGKFYFAKDSTMRPEIAAETMGQKTVDQLIKLKKKYDPNLFFQTDLWNRIFAPLL
ncbi:MAG: FAD-binding protein, partial [Chloroflexota bacterium]